MKKQFVKWIFSGLFIACVLQIAAPVYAFDVFEEVPASENQSTPLFVDASDSLYPVFGEDTPDLEDISDNSAELFTEDIFEAVDSTPFEQLPESVASELPFEEASQLSVGDLSISVPTSWIDNVETMTENDTVWFVHTRSRETGVSGKLFGIAISTDPLYSDLIAEINGQYYSWIEASMDISPDLDVAMEYWTLAEGLYEIRLELNTRYSIFWEEASAFEKELSFVPRYYQTYCTEESAAAVTDAVNGYRKGTVTLKEVKTAVEALCYRTAEVPQIYITTENDNGNSIQKADGYVATDIVIVDTDGSITQNEKSMDSQIKVRGNSTALAKKKPFNIKFASKTNVLGMGKAKKWALLANHYDPTMMRIYCVLKTAKAVGLPYTSECEFAELWVDGVFKGCYLVCESVEAGATRVDIDKSNGEFLLEWQSSREEADVTYLKTPGDWRFECNDPDEPSPEQLANMTEIMTKIENAFKSGDFSQVLQWIDLESFAKYYVLNEWVKTCDFGETSAFFFWKEGKLYAGPAWDYDMSSGNVIRDSDKPEGLYCKRKNVYRELCQYPDFQVAIRKAYCEMLPTLNTVSQQGGLIDTLMANDLGMFLRNETMAGWTVNEVVYPYIRVPDATFNENVAYLQNWLNRRTDWLTENYGKKCVNEGGGLLVYLERQTILCTKRRYSCSGTYTD